MPGNRESGCCCRYIIAYRFLLIAHLCQALLQHFTSGPKASRVVRAEEEFVASLDISVELALLEALSHLSPSSKTDDWPVQNVPLRYNTPASWAARECKLVYFYVRVGSPRPDIPTIKPPSQRNPNHPAHCRHHRSRHLAASFMQVMFWHGPFHRIQNHNQQRFSPRPCTSSARLQMHAP